MNMLPELLKTADPEVYAAMEKELDRLKFQKEMLEKELSTENSSYLEEIQDLTKEIQKIDEELGLKTA